MSALCVVGVSPVQAAVAQPAVTAVRPVLAPASVNQAPAAVPQMSAPVVAPAAVAVVGLGPIASVAHATVPANSSTYELSITVTLDRVLAATESLVLYEKGRPAGEDERIFVQPPTGQPQTRKACVAADGTTCTFGLTTPRTSVPVYVAVVTTNPASTKYVDQTDLTKVGELSYAEAPAWKVDLARDALVSDRVKLTAQSNYIPSKAASQLAIYERDYQVSMTVSAMQQDGTGLPASGASVVTVQDVPHAQEGHYSAAVYRDGAPNRFGDPAANGRLLALSDLIRSPRWSVTFDQASMTARTNFNLAFDKGPQTFITIYGTPTTTPPVNVQYVKLCGSEAGTVCQGPNPQTNTNIGAPYFATVGGVKNTPLPVPLYAMSAVRTSPPTGELGEALNSLVACTSCHSGQPVNTATGVFWHTFVDAALPGRGPGLAVARTYSSADAGTDGMFGYGWAAHYAQRLSIDPSTGDATYTDANNTDVLFSKVDHDFTAPVRVMARLESRPDGGYTLTDHRARTDYVFNSAGVLQSITDHNNETLTLTYSAGKLATATDSSGRALTYIWTGNHVTSIADPMGRVWTYEYAADGTLSKAKDPLNRATAFTYDAAHRLLTMSFPRGGTVTNVYSGSKIATQTDTDGLVTTYTYSGDPASPAGSTTTVESKRGTTSISKTNFSYKFLGLSAVTTGVGTAAAATATLTVDPDTLRLASDTDPMGRVRTYQYDALGNLTRRVDPAVGANPGTVWTSTYNADGTPASSNVPSSTGAKTSTWTYNDQGNLTGFTDANGNTSSYAYGDASHPGDATKVTDPDGRTSDLTYDAYGNIATQTIYPSTGVSLTAAATYNANGEQVCTVGTAKYATGVRCPASFTSPPNGALSRVFDAAGQVTSVTDPKGRTTALEYDLDGNLTKVTGPGTVANGAVRTTSYDTSGRAISGTSAAGSAEAQTSGNGYDILYGASGCAEPALTGSAKYCDTSTDPAGKTTTRYYSGLGQVLGLAEPGGRLTRTTYRLDGLIDATTLPDGRTTTAGYYEDGHLKSVTHSSGSPAQVTYEYSPSGLRSRMTDGTGVTTYAYDSAGYLTQLVRGTSTVGYTRDKSGRVTKITYPSGRVVTRGYDNAGRMTSVNDGAGHTTGYTYDNDGNPVSTSLPTGQTLARTFDDVDQLSGVSLKSATGSTISSLSWTRNEYDQIATETGTGPTSSSKTYTYFATHRLKTTGTETFGYDGAANPTTLGALAQTFAPAGNGQLTSSTRSAETHSYAYDTNGNRTTETTTGGDDLAMATKFDQASHMTTSEVTRTTDAPGSFTALNPCRILDTRTTDPGPAGAVAGGATITVQAGGKCGIPASGVTAIAINLTSTGSTSSNGYATAYSADLGAPPGSSNLNYTVGNTVATLSVVSVSNGGALKIKNYQASGTTHLVGDIFGYYVAGTPTGAGTYKALTPARLLDTRPGSPVGAGSTIAVQVNGQGGVPATGVSAVVLNLTATGGTATSYLTCWPNGTTMPLASNLNFNTSETVSNLVMVAPGADGKVAINNHGGTVDVLVDVVGYYTSGTPIADGAYKTLASPNRILDTRYGTGAPLAKVGPGGEITVQTTGTTGVPATGVSAVVLNVTAVGATANSYVTVYPSDVSRPTASNLNFNAGDAVANTVIVKVSTDGKIKLYNSLGSVDLIADLAGYYTAPTGTNGTTTTTSTYTYTGDGLRQSKTTTTTNGTTTSTTTAGYTYDLAAAVPRLLSDGTNDYIYGPDGRPIEHIPSGGGAPTYYLTDQHGDTRALLDGTGTITAAYSYTAYGVPTRTTGTANTPLLYGSGYTDADTGLIYLLNRYYDPNTGQFTTVDPAILLTASPYGYIGGDPLNGLDPTGLMPTILAGALIGAIAGAGYGGLSYLAGAGSGSFSWQDLGANMAGGAVEGGIIGACLGTLVGVLAVSTCGAAAGAAGNTITQLTDSTPGICGGSIALAAAAGAAGGALGSKAISSASKAANAGARLEIQFGTKIEGQMAKRGWTQESVEDLIANPSRTVATRDTRYLPNGAGRNDAPATAYINRTGGYVVRNDETGDIVQVSNLNDPDWKSPW